jgi:hypothetical protein
MNVEPAWGGFDPRGFQPAQMKACLCFFVFRHRNLLKSHAASLIWAGPSLVLAE